MQHRTQVRSFMRPLADCQSQAMDVLTAISRALYRASPLEKLLRRAAADFY
jgi:hypothetical protein